MKLVRKYSFVAYLAARSNLAYLSEVASRVLFLAVILYIFMRLWQVTYSACGTQVLGGLTLEQMLWYLVVTEAITLSAPRVTQQVDQDVRTGSVAVQLLRPVSYPLVCLFNNLGERFVRFVLFAFAGALVVSLLQGAPTSGAAGAAALLLALPLAFVVDFLASFTIGLFAFWLEDTSGLYLLYSRVTMILGGMLIPLDLFPDWLAPVLKLLPFSTVVWGPAHQFTSPDPGALAVLIVTQLGCIAVLGAMVAAIWNLALKRMVVNGG